MLDNNEKKKIKGCLGKVTSTEISGWAVLEDPSNPAEVDLYFDDKKIINVTASTFRKDLRDKGIHPTGNCAFKIKEFNKDAFKRAKRIYVRLKNTGLELTNSPFYNFSDEALKLDLPDPIFIFTHIPKTGGTSFRHAAELEFGKERTLRDYGKASETTSKEIIGSIYKNDPIRFINILNHQKIRFLSGHFPTKKYYSILKDNVKWIVFLRDPVQRLVSEYLHRKRNQSYTLGLRNFCQNNKFFNLQTRAVAGLGLKDFYFVGLMEEYDHSIKLFNKTTGVRFTSIKANVGRMKIHCVHEVDKDIKNLIERNNSEDVELYQKAQQIFDVNWNQYQEELGPTFGSSYREYVGKLSQKF